MPALVRQEQNTQMKHTRHTSLIEALQIFILKGASGAVVFATSAQTQEARVRKLRLEVQDKG